jgi:hypothetical protein
MLMNTSVGTLIARKKGAPTEGRPYNLLAPKRAASSVTTRELRASHHHLLKILLQSLGWLILKQCLHSLQSAGLAAIKCNREPAR